MEILQGAIWALEVNGWMEGITMAGFIDDLSGLVISVYYSTLSPIFMIPYILRNMF